MDRNFEEITSAENKEEPSVVPVTQTSTGSPKGPEGRIVGTEGILKKESDIGCGLD